MISNFFIWCSGANKEILKECTTERTKFTGIGATIFLTAVLASISGGYAIYFTFNSYTISVMMGLFWGIVIFNLDRYIVSSIRKTGKFKQEFFMALPRIVIALILAITISKPLETRLFAATIGKKMSEIEDKYNVGCERDFNNRRDTLDKRKQQLEDQLIIAKNLIYNNDPVTKDVDSLKGIKAIENRDIEEEINTNYKIIEKNSWLENGRLNKRTGVPIKIRKYNEEAKRRIAQNKQLIASRGINQGEIEVFGDSSNSRRSVLMAQVAKTEKEYNAQIAGIQKQIDDLNAQRGAILLKCKQDAGGNKDILDRLNALGALKVFGNTVWFASWLITLIFALLETAPVIVKLLSNRGPYDDKLDGIENAIFADEKKKTVGRESELINWETEINKINGERRTTRLQIEQDKLNIELQSNKDLLNKIASKQVALTEDIIEQWYTEQRSKIVKSKTNTVPPFSDKLWKAVNVVDDVFYHFKNGQTSQNELTYILNGKYFKGTWEHLEVAGILKIEHLGNINEYEVKELTANILKLENQAGKLELQLI
jgi:Domain of unknown function (DUF4407)